MASFMNIVMFEESSTFIFGSWVCVANSALGFRRHLAPNMEKKASTSIPHHDICNLVDDLDKIQLSNLIGGHEYESRSYPTSTPVQIGLLERIWIHRVPSLD